MLVNILDLFLDHYAPIGAQTFRWPQKFIRQESDIFNHHSIALDSCHVCSDNHYVRNAALHQQKGKITHTISTILCC